MRNNFFAHLNKRADSRVCESITALVRTQSTHKLINWTNLLDYKNCNISDIISLK
jgi:hypothetical protein